MAAITMDFYDLGTEPIETLAERMAGGTLPVFYSVIWATEIACALRDYHARGMVHGEVSTDTIRLHQSGARLQPRGESARDLDVSADIKAFGTVLYEMITGHKPPVEIAAGAFEPQNSVRTLADVRNEAGRLAERCLTGKEEIQHVLIELRLLGLLARGFDGGLRRVKVISSPAPVKPERHRLRIVGRSLTAPRRDTSGASDKSGQPRLRLVESPRSLQLQRAGKTAGASASESGLLKVGELPDSE